MMRHAFVLAALCGALLLLGGCMLWDEDREGQAVGAVFQGAVNKTISDLNPLKPQEPCKEGFECKGGVLMEAHCAPNGQKTLSTYDDPYWCDGDRLMKSTCGGGDVLRNWETTSEVYCSYMDAKRIYCSGGQKLVSSGHVYMCSAADNATMFWASCYTGDVVWRTVECGDGLVCKEAAGTADCVRP